MKALPVVSSAGRHISALAVGLALTALMATSAWAQLGEPARPGAGMMSPTPRGGGGAGADTPAVPPPDAVPGAKARIPAAPATKAVTDMPPTEALFDAINRGDIAAARDALNRGADLNGVDILGMTPMELSVDLGRNDISFLLLSLRGEDSGRGSRAVGRDTGSTGLPGKTAHSGKTARRANVVPVATKTWPAPRLFANDGGTPMPSVGFLGFDSRPASN